MSRKVLVPLVLPADPAAAMEAATKQYVDAQVTGGHNHDAAYVNVSGDTMTGGLQVGGDPNAAAPGWGFSIAGVAYTAVHGSPSVANVTYFRRVSPSSDAGGNYAVFRRNAAANTAGDVTVGSIAINTGGSSVVYNTSSDYRLKDDLGPIPDALDRVLDLQPKRVRWKETGYEADGFIAHEVAEVMPGLVTGARDGEEMQQLDVLGMVPVLVAALQEALTTIQELTSRIVTLEGTT